MFSAQIPIHVSVKGAGTPCFLLHGGPGMDSSYFFPYLDSLSDIFQLHAIDLRGCGRAPRLERSQYTLEAMLQDLENYRQQQGFTKVVVLGHSFGGMLALEYALKCPQAVQALILMTTAARSDFIKLATRNAQRFSQVAEAQRQYTLSERSDADFAELVFHSIPLYFSPGHETSALQMLKKIYFGADCYAALGQGYLADFNLLPQLHDINVPTLVLAAENDLVTPVAFNQEIAERIPHATYHEIAGAGHFPFFEQPIQCIEVIKKWWKSLSS